MDSNRIGLYGVKEATWGTTPASALQELRHTGESLGFNISNTTSNEIRDDRQVTDLIQTDAEAGGGFNFELSYGAFDEYLMAALFSSGWAGVGSGTETITSGATVSNLDFSIDSLNNTIAFGSAVVHGIVKGQWIRLAGAATGNNGYHFVVDVAGQVITVENLTTTETLADMALATIQGGMIRNGITRTSFTLERKHADITQFFVHRGMVVNSMVLTAQQGSILTGSFDFIGKDQVLQPATSGTGPATAATTADVLSCAANVGQIRADGVTLPAGIYLKEISTNLNNSVRGIKALGFMGNVDTGAGEVGLTGSLTAYFKDNSFYDKFLAGTAVSLSYKVEDAAGNAYIVTTPRIKFSDDKVNAGGKNQDVMENISWTAMRDPATDCTIQLDRFAA